MPVKHTLIILTILLMLPTVSAEPSLDRCSFLNNLMATNYTLDCTNETQGRIFYAEKRIVVGDIDHTDIWVLALILFHEEGHALYGTDEGKASRYSISRINEGYNKLIIDLYKSVEGEKCQS